MKQFGCQFWFEAYLDKSTISGDMWNRSLQSILDQIGIVRTLKVGVSIEGSVVRYFFGANKDLSKFSNTLEHMALRPVNGDALPHYKAAKPERFVQFKTDGNVLDINEHYQVNRHKTLVWSLFSLRKVGLQSYVTTTDLTFRSDDGALSVGHKTIVGLPGRLVAVNFRKNEKYQYKKQSKHLDIKKSLHVLTSDPSRALFEVETFPYLPKNAYLGLPNYDFDRHSFIIGATGSGKSKLISLFISQLLSSPMKDQYRVVVIDPHAALEEDLAHFNESTVLTFKSRDDTTDIFSGASDLSAATELTCTLFRSLLGRQYTADVERTLRFSLIVLMTAQVMSLANLKRLLVDADFRNRVTEHVRNYVPENAVLFFERDFMEIMRTSRRQTISPLVELVDEIGLRSSLGSQSNSGEASSLGHVIASNPLTIFSLNKVGMGDKVVKTVAGLLIQQIFLLAQARQFREKIILIIDEVSIVQNPTIAQILAEARKYNLFVFLSQQYFGQIDQPLQNAIFSNVSNYYVFKVSEADARVIEGNITMELPKKMTMESTRILNKEEDLRVPLLTELDPRECVVRVAAGGKVLPAMKARTLDYHQPTQVNKITNKLKTYASQSLPHKYIEPSTPSSVTAASRPQIAPIDTMNLMEVLARQSSRRNTKGER